MRRAVSRTRRLVLAYGTAGAKMRLRSIECDEKAAPAKHGRGGPLRRRGTWWAGQDSNLQPDRYERPALTIELPARAEAAGSRIKRKCVPDAMARLRVARQNQEPMNFGFGAQLSRKLRSFRLREGCFSLRSAFASIWRMRSLVTENCWPTSSSVWSVFMPMPKRMRNTRSSRGVREARTRVVVSRKFDWIAA